MKKNLLLIVPSLRHGGQERVAVNTVAILKSDYNVTLVVFTMNEAVYNVECQAIDLDIPARNGYYYKLLNIFRRRRSLNKLKRELKIDVSISFGNSANLANVLSKDSDKTIVSVHGYSAMSGLYFKRIIDRYVYRSAESVICVAKKITKDLMACHRLPEDKVFTLHNPYDFDSIADQAQVSITYEIRHPAIITMGRLEKVKGYRHLLRAFSIVQQHLPDTTLIFVGEGKLRKELEMMAADLGLKDHVAFLGFQINPFSYIAKCDLFVLSSINEGFPNALVEAMVCAIPAIATDCKSGPREILSDSNYDTVATEAEYADYGILIPPYAADDSNQPELDQLFADAMLRILNDQEICQYYQEKARERARAFSLDVYEHKIIEIIEK